MLDVDDVGAVRAPEGLGIELVQQLFEGSAVGVAFDGRGDYADGAAFDGGEADLPLIDEQQPVLRADDDLAGVGLRAGAGCGLLAP